MRIAALVAFLAVLGCAVTGNARAQSPTPLSRPDLHLHNAGSISATARLPSGELLVAGEFSSFNGVARANLARFLPDGSLDTSWLPATIAADATYFGIYAIAVDPGNGDIYIGGNFTRVGGVDRLGLARLHPDGSLDTSWTPPAVGTPGSGAGAYALALDGSGQLYVGGYFSTIGGAAIPYLARVSTTSGAVDSGWKPAPDGSVNAVVLDGSGNVFVGGSFTTIGGQPRADLAKVSTSAPGNADATWNPAPSGASYVNIATLVVDGGGHLYVGGSFTAIGGQARDNLARIATAGAGAADAWNPAPTGSSGGAVASLQLDGSGNLYVGGFFTSIGGQSISNAARVSVSTGTADPSWNPAPDFYVYAINVGAAGAVDIGGTFINVGGHRHFGFAHIDPTGAASAATPDCETPGIVLAVQPMPDGSAIVAGQFLKSGNVDRKNLLRLLLDGTLDPSWDTAADQFVNAITSDSAGNIFVGGVFSNIGGFARTYVAKLLAVSGDVDPTWNPVLDSQVTALAWHQGYVYLGGYFSTINNVVFGGGLARINSTGTGVADAAFDNNAGVGVAVLALAVDAANGYLYAGGNPTLHRFSLATGAIDGGWAPAPNSLVRSLALDADGNLFVGGYFTEIGGQTRNHIAKIDASSSSGAPDATWNPSADANVYALALDGNGAIYAGGKFGQIGGQARNFIARLPTTGSGAADASWNPSADSSVRVVTVDPDQYKVYAGGFFEAIGGEPRSGVAAFASDVIFANGFE